MKKSTSIIFMFISCFCFSQIQFEHGTWEEIKQKAKLQNKLIFIDAYTTWCGPCKWMTKTTFTNSKVAQYYNATFINAKIDMEKGEGIELAKTYSVYVYPSLLFVNANGELIHRDAGALDTTNFIELGKNALNPDKQFATFQKRYNQGNMDPIFITNYLGLLSNAGLNTKSVLESYFSGQKESDLSNRNNWNLIAAYVNTKDFKEFQYLLSHRMEFNKKYTSDSINQKIYDVFSNTSYGIIYAKTIDTVKLANIQKEILGSGFDRANELVLEINLNYYFQIKDYSRYAHYAERYVDFFKSNNANVLNNVAYEFYVNVKEKDKLIKAESWAKTANELDPNKPYIMDTYACLLFINGQSKSAIEIEEKAIQLLKNDAKNVNPDLLKELQENLDNWKKI